MSFYVCATFDTYDPATGFFIMKIDCIEYDENMLGPIQNWTGPLYATKQECYAQSICVQGENNPIDPSSNNYCNISINSVSLIERTPNSLTVNIDLPDAYKNTHIEYALYDIEYNELDTFKTIDTSNILNKNDTYTISDDFTNVCAVAFRLRQPCAPTISSGSESGESGDSGGVIDGLLPPFLTGAYYQGELSTYYSGLSTTNLRIYNFNNQSLNIEIERRYHPGGLPTNSPSGPGPWESVSLTTPIVIPDSIGAYSSILTPLYISNIVCCYEYRVRFVTNNGVSAWTDYDTSETYTGTGNILPPETPLNIGVINGNMSVVVPGNDNAGTGDTLVEVQGRYMGAFYTTGPGPWYDIIPDISVPTSEAGPWSASTGISINSPGYASSVQFRARIFTTHGAVSSWLSTTWS